MSIFDYPRINFSGLLRLNPGTANNDDYAQPGSGQNLIDVDGNEEAMGLMDSINVSPRMFNERDDHAYREWIQKAHPFSSPGGHTQHTIPAEWNYYGDMSSTPVDITVKGVQPGDVRPWSNLERDILDQMVGARLDFYGNITDVNPEGQPPATQFFMNDLSLRSPDQVWLESTAADKVRVSKGVGLWINFFRNVSLGADDGAGTSIHQVIRGDLSNIPGFGNADGMVMRSYIYRPIFPPNIRNLGDDAFNTMMEHWYRVHRTSPKTLQIMGTLAPWYDHEPAAMPPGRQLISRHTNLDTKGFTKNNGSGKLALAPAVAHRINPPDSTVDVLAVDFSGSFPDHFVSDDDNPKYRLEGAVLLRVVNGSEHHDMPVEYMTDHDAKGWILEFDLSDQTLARELLDGGGTLQVILRPNDGKPEVKLLDEVDYYIVTDQLAVYAERHTAKELMFRNQGSEEPVILSVYHRGERMARADAPTIDMWWYRSAPIQSPGDAPDTPRQVEVEQSIWLNTERPGARLLTFRAHGETNPPRDEFPPKKFGDFAYPPAFGVTWAPQISLRILPDDHYEEHFVEPGAAEPVTKPHVDFHFVYENTLRTYALLFPSMNNKIDLSSEEAMRRFAAYVLAAVDPEFWMSVRFMPPTRDLSAGKRRLLQAWCRRVLYDEHGEDHAHELIERAKARLRQ
ncbi:MAG: hypothetical protein AAF567_15885 [Actinomycetota bacterium]